MPNILIPILIFGLFIAGIFIAREINLYLIRRKLVKNGVKVYNKQGNEVLIDKEEWKNKIIPNNIEKAWDNPDELYELIVGCLKDGFVSEINEASDRLLQIEKNSERSNVVRAIVLMKNGKFDEAENILNSYINLYGKTGVVVNNLAKVYAERKDNKKAEMLLWESITLDPNQENALGWWGSIHNERGGNEGFLRAMKEASSIKGSWRPQLWLARELLKQGNLTDAIKLYAEILKISDDNPDALLMISGDLGLNGYSDEIINLVVPVYDPQKHGPRTGFNILHAYLEKKDFLKGRSLIYKLRELDRKDLVVPLTEIEKKFEAIRVS